MKKILFLGIMSLLFIIGCSTDPQIFDVGSNGTFVSDTLKLGEVLEYYDKTDTINTIESDYILLSNLPQFESRAVLLLTMTGEEYSNKIITSLIIKLYGTYYNGPDIDSVRCPVYRLTQKWSGNNDPVWNDLFSIVDYSKEIGYLKLTDSLSIRDTLKITDLELLKSWQDSLNPNFGFIVEIPNEYSNVQKTYFSLNGDLAPEIVFTYLDSLNDPEEKKGTSPYLNDMFVFNDNTNLFFNDPNYYYLENIYSNVLRFQIDLDTLRQFIDENNASLVSAQLRLPADISKSYYNSSSVLPYGIYPLAEGWTPDSLAKLSNFTSGLTQASVDKITSDGYLTFTDDFNTSVFTNNHVTSTINGEVSNNSWILEPIRPIRGYQIVAIPKNSAEIQLIVNYWIPPEPRY